MYRGLMAAVLTVVLVISACGGETITADPLGAASATVAQADPTPAESPEQAPTPEPTPEPVEEPSGAVNAIADVRTAVVQITSTGTFIDPSAGIQSNVVGSGTGFIIDESGLAVTNNHVVTGAAVLEVFLDGEDSPRNARLLGVSECSDLAVIDIDGEGFSYLEWHEGPITAGMSIFAAGFPLGDPEYTLLDGIVSKEDAGGETSWASIDAVIEHSADTLPGNSGGPIVTEQGQVIAVNYAGNEAGQSFAIGREVALPIIEELAADLDVDSVGINGEAVVGDGIAGIWVYSVASGSPADTAGIEAGDLITRSENLDMAIDGTMADYCDVLRSRQVTDPIAIEVYRSSSDEVLEGQLNGEPLEVTFSFSNEFADSADAPSGGGSDYTEFVAINDDTAAIIVSVPAEWSETDGREWDFYDDGNVIGVALTAAPSLEGWRDTWGTPGMFLAASAVLPYSSTVEMLDDMVFSESCTYSGREDYDDGLYTGQFDFWENCGFEGSTFVVVAAEPADGSFLILLEMVVTEERDWAAVDEVIASYEVLLPVS